MPIAFAALALALAFDGRSVTRLGRGMDAPIADPLLARQWWTVLAVLLGLFGLFEAVRAFRLLRRLPPSVAEARPQATLSLGEPILWSARLGLRAFGKEHAARFLAMLLAATSLFLSLRWLLHSPTFDAGGLSVMLFRILFGLGLLAAFGPMAFGPLWWALFRENRWLHALTGRLVVTDRRLAWLSLRGRVVDEISAERIVEVVLTAPARDLGEELHLVLRGADGAVEEQVLRRLPRAAEAAAALSRIAPLTRP